MMAVPSAPQVERIGGDSVWCSSFSRINLSQSGLNSRTFLYSSFKRKPPHELQELSVGVTKEAATAAAFAVPCTLVPELLVSST